MTGVESEFKFLLAVHPKDNQSQGASIRQIIERFAAGYDKEDRKW